jgi:hypothetical protein
MLEASKRRILVVEGSPDVKLPQPRNPGAALLLA